MTERTVSDSLIRRPVLSAAPHATVFEAASLMTKANCGSVLILEDSGVLRGIFTERDLMTRVVAKSLPPESTPLADVMTHNPHVISPQTRVYEAVYLMKQAGIRHLPILSAEANVIGVFSIRDALPAELTDAEHLAEHLDQQFSDILA